MISVTTVPRRSRASQETSSSPGISGVVESNSQTRVDARAAVTMFSSDSISAASREATSNAQRTSSVSSSPSSAISQCPSPAQPARKTASGSATSSSRPWVPKATSKVTASVLLIRRNSLSSVVAQAIRYVGVASPAGAATGAGASASRVVPSSERTSS
ncbi:hypothetical protein M271_08095 [Streptomyces rapamycinicus NRRL 5491]|nr:hypothetical protein M271_08095 [Streptomyces rapamycinicus NRRL 5491]